MQAILLWPDGAFAGVSEMISIGVDRLVRRYRDGLKIVEWR